MTCLPCFTRYAVAVIVQIFSLAFAPSYGAEAPKSDGISVVKESDLQAAETAFLAIPIKERPAALLAASGLANKKFSEWISARSAKTPVDRVAAAFIVSKTMLQMSEMARLLDMPMAMNCHANEAVALELASKGEPLNEPICRKAAYAGIDKQMIELSKSGRLAELVPTINIWVNTIIFYNIGVAHRARYKI